MTTRAARCFFAALLALCAAVARAGDVRTLETRHYRLHTDVADDLAQDLARRLDAMHDEYATRLARFAPAASSSDAPKFDCYVYERRRDYAKLTQDRMPNSGGIFMPSRRLLAAFLEEQGRDTLRRTLQHEAFHQFSFEYLAPDLPVWANEGMAQVFEEGLWTGSGFRLGQVPPRRLRQLQRDMRAGRLLPFDAFVALTHEDWARRMRDRDLGGSMYNQAWAMTHFLVYAANARGEPAYRERYFDFLRRARRGDDAVSAFTGAFGDNWLGFQQRFDEWARDLRATEEAACVERLGVLADMRALLAADGVELPSLDHFRRHAERHQLRVTYTSGALTWKSDADVAGYFRDARGRLLAETERLVELPREDAPLADLVLRPGGGLAYRARFHPDERGRVEHEVLVVTDPAGGATSALR